MDVANELLDAIEIIVDKKVRENTTQIYPGICKSVSGGSCVMSINGKDNTIQFYGSIPIVGAIYRVFVPDGNMSMAFAITGNDDRKGLHYSNPNLLDNWYFGNLVNQRGILSGNGPVNAYGIDRWKFLNAGTLTIGSDYIAIASDEHYYTLQQYIEPGRFAGVIGMTATLSALVKGYGRLKISLGSSSVQAYSDYVRSSDWTIVQMQGKIVSGTDYHIFVQARKGEGDFYVKAVKLELGSQQTLAQQDADGNWVLNEIPDYGEQLRRCQRYFVNFNPNKVNWFAMPPAVASNTTEAYSAVTLPVAMRAQPTVSYGGKIALSQTDDVQVTGIQVSGSTFAGNYLQLKYSVADGLTANSTYRVQGYNDPTSYIWLSADL